MKLGSVLRCFSGVGRLFAARAEPVEAPTVWVPPPVRRVPADVQARLIVEAWQEAGETAVPIPRGEIWSRYIIEHCDMFGFKPVKFNALCTELGKICQKRRIWEEGHYITAYVFPDPTETPWPALPNNVFPMGNKQAATPVKTAPRPRSGALHAQA
jgi:hypothetical protein